MSRPGRLISTLWGGRSNGVFGDRDWRGCGNDVGEFDGEAVYVAYDAAETVA
jgi:hypothetical protein